MGCRPSSLPHSDLVLEHMRTSFVFILQVSVLACAPDERPVQGADSPSVPDEKPSWVVSADSFGPLPLGVPLARAESALGAPILAGVPELESCSEVRPRGLPPGASLMVIRDTAGAPVTLERVDVHTAGIRTRQGVGVGDAEESVLAVYRGQVQVQPHKYTGPEGHYLVVTLPRDTLFQIIFETDGQHVTRFRAGRKPAVQYVEGCA